MNILQDADELQILSRLRSVVDGKLAVDPKSWELNARLSEIGVDSFSLIELVFIAEEEFGIKVPIDGISVTTVKDVVVTISKQISLARAG